MKRRMKPVVYCAVSALTLSMIGSTMTMAAGLEAGTNTTLNEADWESRAVADVNEELFIRSSASDNGTIIGHMPSAGGAYVLEKGDEWTKIISGDVVGYVKTYYLAFGEDARELAEVYGTPGVVTSWDGVNIFNDADSAAKILDTANRGEGYEILSDDGLWVTIQLEDGNNAYVPSEDVKSTLLLDEAVPNEKYQAPTSAYGNTIENVDNSYGVSEETTYTESQPVTIKPEADSWTKETEVAATETDNTDTWVPETDAAVTETPETDWAETEATDWAETEPETWVPETSAPETSAPETSAPETSAPETEAPSVDANADDLNLLASIIYCEAGNQPWDGKVAVGAVVLNRVASPSFASSIHDVIYESGQFMPTWDGSMASALANGVPSECYDAANAALSGENPVGGALYFNTGANRGIQIGAHFFW